jgi:hypothetical protein
VSDCAVSSSYRLRLLHLPVHEGVQPADIDAMGDLLRQVLGSL